jgi:FO synthase
LFTLGDRPEDRWPKARDWLDEQGYDSTLGYVRAMAVRVLEDTGLLPHLNPGVMSWEEITRLKPVAPSMGMMLETISGRLFETRGLAHFGSPDKDPAVRPDCAQTWTPPRISDTSDTSCRSRDGSSDAVASPP